MRLTGNNKKAICCKYNLTKKEKQHKNLYSSMKNCYVIVYKLKMI